jgi:hypothetical protein
MYQFMVRNRAVYYSNFTPTLNLTPDASEANILFFLGSNYTDLVKGTTVSATGTVSTTYRTLA